MYIVSLQDERIARDERTTANHHQYQKMMTHVLKKQITEFGARVKVKWTADDIVDSGWRPGWYTAHVQGYEDIITLHIYQVL